MTRQEAINNIDMKSIEERIAYADERIKQLGIAIQAEDFTDQRVANGFALYKGILKSTVEIFGEDKLTETVLCQLIETAGYSTWRAIMGAKSGEQEIDNWKPVKRI